jgi:hypothetical protein
MKRLIENTSGALVPDSPHVVALDLSMEIMWSTHGMYLLSLTTYNILIGCKARRNVVK